MLSGDFPPWQAVEQQSEHWTAAGCFEGLIYDLRALKRPSQQPPLCRAWVLAWGIATTPLCRNAHTRHTDRRGIMESRNVSVARAYKVHTDVKLRISPLNNQAFESLPHRICLYVKYLFHEFSSNFVCIWTHCSDLAGRPKF